MIRPFRSPAWEATAARRIRMPSGMGFNPRSHFTKCPKSLVLSKFAAPGKNLPITPFFVGLVRAGSVDEHLVEN